MVHPHKSPSLLKCFSSYRLQRQTQIPRSLLCCFVVYKCSLINALIFLTYIVIEWSITFACKPIVPDTDKNCGNSRWSCLSQAHTCTCTRRKMRPKTTSCSIVPTPATLAHIQELRHNSVTVYKKVNVSFVPLHLQWVRGEADRGPT
jgi:hypothetical protein